MKDENRWKPLDKHFLACIAKARLIELHRLQVRDPCESVIYSVN
jgi:hypothetical protein